MFKKPFSFIGRIRRLEYGLTVIAYVALILGVQAMDAIGMRFVNLLTLPAIFMLWAQGAKRCHDLGKNGWWQIIPLYVIVLIFQPGTGELNEYGYPPRRTKEEKDMSLESEINSIGEKI
jgi:uncharacterized membrane protein YhaH (DUF805 family)